LFILNNQNFAGCHAAILCIGTDLINQLYISAHFADTEVQLLGLS